MNEIEYDIAALHYIADNTDMFCLYLAKFIMRQHVGGSWDYGIRCIGYEGCILFIG